MAFEVEPNSLGLAFESLRALGVQGVNLTIPFKETAYDLVDEIPDDMGRALGALNTVVNKDGYLFGHNTDANGFLMALHEELAFKPQGKTALVLGAGGAARAVVFALLRAQVGKIWIYNRTMDRAVGLVEYAARFFPEADVEVAETPESLSGEKIDLIVNATSLGMGGPESTAKPGVPFDLATISSKPAVYDLIYAPSQTAFLKAAADRGLQTTNGLGMLINQAALAFELWTGHKEGVRETMRKAIGL